MELYGGIEAGGTKFVCAVGTGPDNVVDEIRFPTTAPEETIGKSLDFFRGASRQGRDVARRRHRLVRPGGPEPRLAHLGLRHLDAQARLGQHQLRRAGARGAGRPRRLRHRRQRRGPR